MGLWDVAGRVGTSAVYNWDTVEEEGEEERPKAFASGSYRMTVCEWTVVIPRDGRGG